MKVGILGSGIVAQVLASGFLKHGHDVMAGTRDPAKLADWQKQNPAGSVGRFEDVADAAPVNGVLRYFTNLDESLMERLQSAFPDLRLVKAFSSVGNARMVNPHFDAGRPTMFICGNDLASKQTVTQILDQFGWETEDMGGVEAARAIEPLCMLWCIPGFVRNEWTHAFKLLR